MRKLKKVLSDPKDVDLRRFHGLTEEEQIMYIESLPTVRGLKADKRRNFMLNVGVGLLVVAVPLGTTIRACNQHRAKTTTTLQTDCADPDLDMKNYENCINIKEQ